MASEWRLRDRLISAAIPVVPALVLLVAALLIVAKVEFLSASWWQVIIVGLAFGVVVPLLRGGWAIFMDRTHPDDEDEDEDEDEED